MIKNLSEQLHSFGLCEPRNYYIPFSDGQENGRRTDSKRFVSLDGVWSFRAYASLEYVPDDFCGQELSQKIAVPSCVQYYGYDFFQYTNVRYPIPFAPLRVPRKNPAYQYSRTFSVNGDETYYLLFEGVDSCFYVYVNGQFVGFSQISHRMSEFDITAYVHAGENRLDVVVQKWCAGTYFEDQDKWRFTGIFRSVYLLCRPQQHIEDYKIETFVSGGEAEVRFSYRRGTATAEVCFGRQKKKVRAGKTVCFSVRRPRLWSAETPFLYDMTIRAGGETIYEKVGLRTVEVRDGTFLLNGKPVKMYGVNRHDFHPEKGAAVSEEDMEEDVRLMKSLNVNTVRTSHYPSAPEFYKLCDKYGLYVISEADLETHGTDTVGEAMNGVSWIRKLSVLTDDEQYRDTYIERQIVNVEVNKNRPCVLIWSLGNESGFGRNILAASREVKSRDPRPVHYEPVTYIERPAESDVYYSDVVDIQSRMYPSFEWLRDDFLSDTREWRPLFLCEYAHAMGNGPGGLKEYWDIFESSERFMGGCIWEWADHSISYRGAPFRYGGDFGERTHDNNFCVDGIVTADRKIKSGTLEMKKAYQPLWFRKEGNTLKIFNRNYFAPAKGALLVTYKNYGESQGEESREISVPPREWAQIACRTAQTVHVRFVLQEEQNGVPAGTCLAFENFFEEAFVPQVCSAEIAAEEGLGELTVRTGDVEAVFDKLSGEIRSLRYRGRDFGGVRLVLWRAKTDNDWNVHPAYREAADEAREIVAEGNSVVVKGHFVRESLKPLFSYESRYTFTADGVCVETKWQGSDYGEYVPRFGLCMKLPASFSALRYCAYGPGESYSDKHLGAYKDVFTSDVSREYEHKYVKPQESGSHFGADFAELSDGNIVLRAEGMQSFCAIPYSADALSDAAHDDELPASDAVYFTADYGMSGVGSNSCGPKLPVRYRFPQCGKGRIAFRFSEKQ